MDNATIKCEHCGTFCFLKDGYCKNCWKKLTPDVEQDNFILDGIGESQWEQFIEKNASRYMQVYKKNKDKKLFLNMNWSAFFFGISWVLYRKMYKVAIIGFLITSLLTALLTVLLFLPHVEEMKSLNTQIAPFLEYVESGKSTVLVDENGEYYSPEVVKKGAQAEKRLYEIELGIKAKSLLIIPFSCLFWGLFGDAIYRMYIRKNITYKSGGASIASWFGGQLLLNLIELLALNPLISLIAGLLIN